MTVWNKLYIAIIIGHSNYRSTFTECSLCNVYLILSSSVGSKYGYDLLDEERKSQRGKVAYLRSHTMNETDKWQYWGLTLELSD